MKNLIYGIIAMGLLASGCAITPSHEHKNGSIVAIDTPSEAHVCLKSTEVQVGEQLSLFKNICVTKTKAPTRLNPDSTEYESCEKKAIGLAEVTDNSDTHLVKVKALGGVSFQAGETVERVKN